MKEFLKKIAASYIDLQKAVRTEYDHFKLRKKIDDQNKLVQSKKLSSPQKSEIRNFYKTYGFNKVNCEWHRFYTTCNGIFSVKYIPEDLFYLILEPKLNRYDFAPALSDKNLLNQLFPSVRQPETIVKNISGIYYFDGEIIDFKTVTSLCNAADKMIIKPAISSYGGKNVRLFHCENGVTDYLEEPLEKFLAAYKANFIIQKCLTQHPLLEALNKTSINTFRVMSYMNDRGSKVLSLYVRMGRKGAINDNVSTGGFACGIQRNGNLNEVGFDLYGKKVKETDGGLKFIDLSFPFVDKLVQKATELHKQAPHFKIISWDLSINPEEEVVLIEYNIYGQDFSGHQMHNGPVLEDLLQEL